MECCGNLGGKRHHQGSKLFKIHAKFQWMKAQLSGALVDLRKDLEGYTITTTKLSSCQGESRVLIVRGKKRAGFEFELEIHWTGRKSITFSDLLTTTASRGAETLSGTLKIHELSETNLDDFEVMLHSSAQSSCCRLTSLFQAPGPIRPPSEKRFFC